MISVRSARIIALMTLQCAVLFSPTVRADEGMYPLTHLQGLDLRAKGLEITARDLYNPDSIDLADAIVSLRGCSGSFVSGEGLILTNYHCAFGAIQSISSTERDLLASGFTAATRAEEIPLEGQTARIKERARDVSSEVLSAVEDTTEPAERTRLIRRRIREIVAAEEAAHPGTSAEVAEMFPGRSYVLYTYRTLRDIRLVFAPPRTVGEFGGEEDNWVWPRHTGDFTFYRAYCAPDGSPATHAPENVPHRPRRHLTVQAGGVDDGDAVFILGYPGRTMRHQPAAHLAFEQEVRMPFIARLYDELIRVMEETGRTDPAVALRHAPRMKSLANTLKNYRGKMQGIRRLGLLGVRQEEEKALGVLGADSARSGRALRDIGRVYADITATAHRDLILDQLPRASILLDAALTIHEAGLEAAKPDSARTSRFTGKNIGRTQRELLARMRNLHLPSDRLLLRGLLERAGTLPADACITGLPPPAAGEDLDGFLDRLYDDTRLADTALVAAALLDPEKRANLAGEPFLRFAQELFADIASLRTTRHRREGELNRLLPLYVDAREAYFGKSFLPDANSTMRFTHGRVRGYAPADAVYYDPITTLTGLQEKTSGRTPYVTPQVLLDGHAAARTSRFAHPRLGDVPVALLYNLDTVGGNSGSPLMNARGELVGVNFDRAYEATVNDFAWSESYSRSIAVDIRFVLWVTTTLGASHLLTEMGVR